MLIPSLSKTFILKILNSVILLSKLPFGSYKTILPSIPTYPLFPKAAFDAIGGFVATNDLPPSVIAVLLKSNLTIEPSNNVAIISVIVSPGFIVKFPKSTHPIPPALGEFPPGFA